MSAPEVTAAVVAELGYGPEAAAGMATRVWATLIYLAKRGGIVKEGKQATARWALKATEVGREF